MLKLAENENGIALTANDLDCDPMLFNVLNGTIDLQSGTLRDPRREDLITKIAPVNLSFSAECPRWDRFLLEVMGGGTGFECRVCMIEGTSGNYPIEALIGDFTENPTTLHTLHGTEIAASRFLTRSAVPQD